MNRETANHLAASEFEPPSVPDPLSTFRRREGARLASFLVALRWSTRSVVDVAWRPGSSAREVEAVVEFEPPDTAAATGHGSAR